MPRKKWEELERARLFPKKVRIEPEKKKKKSNLVTITVLPLGAPDGFLNCVSWSPKVSCYSPSESHNRREIWRGFRQAPVSQMSLPIRKAAGPPTLCTYGFQVSFD